MYTSEGILKFYKENLTIVGLTKKKYKVWFYVLFFSFILLTLGGGVMMIMKYYAFFNKNPLIVFGGVIFITILFALIINYLKFSAMKEKNRAYVKYADNIKLNILHFYPLNIELITENFHSQLRSYLQKNKITKKIVEIIFLLEENAKKEAEKNTKEQAKKEKQTDKPSEKKETTTASKELTRDSKFEDLATLSGDASNLKFEFNKGVLQTDGNGKYILINGEKYYEYIDDESKQNPALKYFDLNRNHPKGIEIQF